MLGAGTHGHRRDVPVQVLDLAQGRREPDPACEHGQPSGAEGFLGSAEHGFAVRLQLADVVHVDDVGKELDGFHRGGLVQGAARGVAPVIHQGAAIGVDDARPIRLARLAVVLEAVDLKTAVRAALGQLFGGGHQVAPAPVVAGVGQAGLAEHLAVVIQAGDGRGVLRQGVDFAVFAEALEHLRILQRKVDLVFFDQVVQRDQGSGVLQGGVERDLDPDHVRRLARGELGDDLLAVAGVGDERELGVDAAAFFKLIQARPGNGLHFGIAECGHPDDVFPGSTAAAEQGQAGKE